MRGRAGIIHIIMFHWFEKFVHPYPDAAPATLPRDFLAFVWACTRGLRGYIVAMTLLTAVIGAFEALLFAMMGRIVDSLAQICRWRSCGARPRHAPAARWRADGEHLRGGLQTLYKHQALAGNFPMRLRWNFHRLMLDQSMGFYQDEFAGRIATKVMQSALAVRDFCMIVADILVYVVIYFVTMTIVLGGFDLWLLVPFGRLGRALWTVDVVLRASPRRDGQAAGGCALADDGPHHRCLHEHRDREAVLALEREADYARSAMKDFLVDGASADAPGERIRDLQPGDVRGADLEHGGDRAVGVEQGRGGRGFGRGGDGHGHAAQRHLALDHVGAGEPLRAGGHGAGWHRHAVAPAHGRRQAGCRATKVTRGEVRFEKASFSYGGGRKVIEDFSVLIRPGEKIGLVGRSGAGKSTIVNLLLRFYDLQQGRILIDGQDIAQCTQESLRAQIGMVTQDTSLLHRSVRDNIVYGRPDATDEQMMRAARARRGR